MTANLSKAQLRFNEVALVLKAIADPYRLHILDLLAQGETGHSELKEQLGLPPNLLSHHLRVLRQAGLIRVRHDTLDARWLYYTIDPLAWARWQTWLNQFLDPDRLQARAAVSGPEGQGQRAETSWPRKTNRPRRRYVLFLCTGNSCRSQMAEAIINTQLGHEWRAVSAGTQPAGFVHPKAISTLAEMGIDWRGRSSKPADKFRAIHFDLIVTLCDNARQNHPSWLDESQLAPLHLGFPDPAQASGSEEEVATTFRTVRDAIAEQVPALLRTWPRSQ